MSKLVYPLYVQEESIASLYGQTFETAEQSRKITHSKGQAKSSEKKIGLAVSLLQVLGLQTDFRREDTESSGYTAEEMRIVGPEDKLRFVRLKLSEQGTLYDLNASLAKKRPFGSFVDFRAVASFYLLPSEWDDREPTSYEETLAIREKEFVKVVGDIEDYRFTTICSRKYFETSSWLIMTLTTEKNPNPKTVPIVGFGVVLDFNPESKEITLKALMLAQDPSGFYPK